MHMLASVERRKMNEWANYEDNGYSVVFSTPVDSMSPRLLPASALLPSHHLPVPPLHLRSRLCTSSLTTRTVLAAPQ